VVPDNGINTADLAPPVYQNVQASGGATARSFRTLRGQTLLTKAAHGAVLNFDGEN
jgi:hypothetical protein